MSSRFSAFLIILALFLLAFFITDRAAEASPATTVDPALPVVNTTHVAPKFHKVVVRTGDTLSTLAVGAHLKSWRPIWNANRNIKNPHRIFPGWVLRVPRPGVHVKNRPLPATRRPLEATQNVSARVTAPSTVDGGVWDRIAQCESGGNWSANTGNGYYGGLQFDLTSWQRVGGSGLPSDASKAEQIMRAVKLQALQGWGSWPVCAAFMA